MALTSTVSGSDSLVRATARFFRVLGDPTRLAILQMLEGGSLTVAELVEATGIPRSRLSNHLACLRYCGFVETEPEGRTVRYSLVDGDIASLIAHASAAAAQREEHLSSCTRIGPEWV